MYSPAAELSRFVTTVSMLVRKAVSEDADCAVATEKEGDVVVVYFMVVNPLRVDIRLP